MQNPPLVTIPATELNLRSGKVLRRAAVDREHIVIERNGYPLAVIIPVFDYQQLTEREVIPSGRGNLSKSEEIGA